MSSVSAICSRGIHAYLAEQHSYFRNKKLGVSLISGIIGSGLLLGVNQYTSLDIPTPMLFVPLAFTTAIGLGEGMMLQNKDDLEHKEAFDFMCKEKEGEEDEGN
jgi:hypothetical protein